MSAFRRLIDAFVWRWQRLVKRRYLLKTFVNGRELAHSYEARTNCETAIGRNGASIHHPANRVGFAGMILEVWYDQVYSGRFYSPAPGDVVIDGGANIGLFSLLIAKTCPGCRVLAFEPFEENFRLLQTNLASARANNVEPFQMALAGSSGRATMIDGGGRSQDHRLRSAGAGEVDPLEVPTCSFHDLLTLAGDGQIALFKCDIEGSEADLFTHATPDELRGVGRYAIEYHDNIRPGTLDLLRARLAPTHEIVVKPATDGAYGMLYAVQRGGRR